MINEQQLPLLTIEELTIGYKNKPCSKPLCAELHQGKLVCLIGSNGEGKSTLLRTIAHLMKPISGTITIYGKHIKSYSSASLARLISIVLTRSESSSITAYEVVAMGRSPYTGFFGRLSEQDKHIIDNSLRFLDITSLSKRKMNTLSDGERQKVMIAKAMAQATPIILLDEPTAFLDYTSKAFTFDLLHRMASAQQKAILVSSHDLELALRYADELWIIDKAKGLTIGATSELTASGMLQQYFPSLTT